MATTLDRVVVNVFGNYTTPTNINFTPKNLLVRSAWTGQPAPTCKLALAGTPAQPCVVQTFSLILDHLLSRICQ